MSNDITKCCALCEYAENTVGEDMICLKKGPVHAEYHCRKFRYDPFKRVPPSKAPLKFETELEPL